MFWQLMVDGGYMNSLIIREFRQSIESFVAKSELPDEVKRMVLAEILKAQEEATVLTLRKEIEERDIAEQEDGVDAESVCEN